MVMRATISALAAAAKAPRGGSLRLFSTTSTISSSFPFPQNTQQTPAREQAEPNTNLFVSGKCPFPYVSYSVEKPMEGRFGWLSKRTTTEGLQEAFSKFGEVVQAKVVTDRTSGYSKGFGFVKYATLENAAEGIKGMDGQFLDGWVIFAEYAKPKPPPSQPQNNMGPGYGNYTGPNNSWQ
ncbi:GLYCINE-RICH RNA-BINDING PROTEIN 3 MITOCHONDRIAL-LIKE [Salix purpurea]|uniref:GLYCINE-RICH RNA-BINDING PROTEIN 3 MITOCHONDRIAL-LIKE n=1 Tax=Salix purpurea TaxID=77065 RepID=A0A9Q1A0L2_SALPP|nr:GLYCINE-RICH RNA-BINDING PROTEIN 3 MITOCHONDRIAL-LIKE [Salix purpurea]